MTKRLESVDPDDLRCSVWAMRDALTAVADDGSEEWVGDWATLVPLLVAAGRADLCLGRLVEGHADAMRILGQAETAPREGVYGVWASRSAGTGLRAECRDDTWVLTGELRFASGIDLIDRALVPGWIDPEHHLLFDVPLSDFHPDRDSWPTSAMDGSRSFTCHGKEIPAGEPIGPEDFYLDRPGFAIGGLGPAAVWLGGAERIALLVAEGLLRFSSTTHQLRRLGVIEEALWRAGAAMECAVRAADQGEPAAAAGQIGHARTAVVEAADIALQESAVIVGPAGLSANRRLVRTREDSGDLRPSASPRSGTRGIRPRCRRRGRDRWALSDRRSPRMFSLSSRHTMRARRSGCAWLTLSAPSSGRSESGWRRAGGSWSPRTDVGTRPRSLHWRL